ncbi:MAG: ABC transporter permease [Candidatus Odinarchaeota archaeon]
MVVIDEPLLESKSDRREFLIFVLKRLLRAVVVIWGVVTIVFILFRVLPGNVALILAGKFPTPDFIAAINRKWGLDKPLFINIPWLLGYHQSSDIIIPFLGKNLYLGKLIDISSVVENPSILFDTQYVIFLSKLIFEFDLGISYIYSTPVVYELGARFPATIELTLVSMLLATIIGVPIGIISAYKQHTRIDYITMTVALVGVSMPVYWLGLMLQDIFSKNLSWFIATGRIDPVLSAQLVKYTDFYLVDSFIAGVMQGRWEFFISTTQQLVLPSLALATIPLAVIARMTRSSVLEELQKDYVRTARSKGLNERLVILKHVTKNAMIPTITVIGLNFGALLAGAVLTETIFSWPGVGKFVWDSITKRDSPVIMGFVMIVALIFVAANMITDIIYAYLDPRVRYYKKE